MTRSTVTPMEPRCKVCNDTGSKSQRMDGDLDCTHCEATEKRRALRKHLAQFTSYPDNDTTAWAAYLFAQRQAVQGVAEGVLRDYVAPEPFAYFVQPSSFGPFIECESSQVGAFAAYRAPAAAQSTVVAVRQPEPEMREFLRDALASGLTGFMREDDLYPASDCQYLLDELCDVAIATLGPFAAAPSIAAPAEVERDAKRYRWLRDSSVGQWEHPIVVEQLRDRMFDRINYIGPLFGCALETAIDAAIATGEKHDN